MRTTKDCVSFQNFLAEADKDGDHQISKEEFFKQMNKIDIKIQEQEKAKKE